MYMACSDLRYVNKLIQYLYACGLHEDELGDQLYFLLDLLRFCVMMTETIAIFSERKRPATPS